MTDITRPPDYADIAILNAAVYTADTAQPRRRAVAVKDGRIICAGDNSDVLPLVGGGTALIDANGRTLAPGMVDAHQHMLGGVRACCHNICLTTDMGHEEYLEEIARYIRLHPDQSAYTGTGFMPELYGCRGPRREALDSVCADKPVVILSYDGHTTWVNSKALSELGVTKDTPDPENGVIHKDRITGEPTGYMAGSAGACEGGMMRVFMPRYTRAQNKAAILHAQELMFKKGVTCVYDAHVEPDADYYMAYEELARTGELELTVRGAWFVPRDVGDEAEINALIDRCIALSGEFATERFQVNGFKFLCDQVCEAETAYLTEPYSDRADGWQGVRIWEDGDMLARIFAKIDAAGFQIHLHQIGDGAARYALDALEKAEKINGGLRMRHTFAHCQFITEPDKARMARMGVNALAAPYWINSTIFKSMDIPHLGRDRACRQYPVLSLMEMGINVGAHSDYTVSMPDWCDALYGLTARVLSPRAFDVFYRRVTGACYTLDPCTEPEDHICCPLPDQRERIDIENAVRCLTANGARSMYLDSSLGAIVPGMEADMVLLDSDVASIASPMARCVRVDMTICRGKIVYETDPGRRSAMISLRGITEENFDAIIAMKRPEGENFVAPNSVSLAQCWLYRENGDVFPCAIYADETPVGFMLLEEDMEEEKLMLWRIMLPPDNCGRGYGSRAVKLLIEQAKSSGKYAGLYLDCSPENTAARRMYEKLGFMPTGDINHGDVEMCLALR